MENKSLNNRSRRQRGNQSGGGNRNRNNRNRNRNRNSGGNRNRGGNRGGGNRNNRNRSRYRKPKQTKWQKFLSTITFGLLGKPKLQHRSERKKEKPATQNQKKSAPAKKSAKRSPRRNRTEVTSGRLYVGNLVYDAVESDLEELFKGAGNVISAEVVTNSRTQQSKGFAFVEMGSIDEAKRAVQILDDEDFRGRKLIVSGARSEGPRDDEKEDADDETSAPEAPAEEPVAAGEVEEDPAKQEA